MRRLALALALCGFAGCFHPDKPACSFVCADSDPKCPDDYECRADNYCHLTKSAPDESCNFSDAAVAPIDLQVPDAAATDMLPATTDASQSD